MNLSSNDSPQVDDHPDPHRVVIDYTNYRLERSKRTIVPILLWWGSTEWHPEPQHLLRAWDVEKRSKRDFAMRDIHSWSPAAVPEAQ